MLEPLLQAVNPRLDCLHERAYLRSQRPDTRYKLRNNDIEQRCYYAENDDIGNKQGKRLPQLFLFLHVQPFSEKSIFEKLKHRVDQVCQNNADHEWHQYTDNYLDRAPDCGKLENKFRQNGTDQKAYDRIDRDREVFGIFLKPVLLHVNLLYKKMAQVQTCLQRFFIFVYFYE